jgi:hypothetical protein
MDLDKGVEAYSKAKENDVKPNNATFANLLSLTAGFGEQGLFAYIVYYIVYAHILMYAYIYIYIYISV